MLSIPGMVFSGPQTNDTNWIVRSLTDVTHISVGIVTIPKFKQVTNLALPFWNIINFKKSKVKRNIEFVTNWRKTMLCHDLTPA